jgi:hypothetical protein
MGTTATKETTMSIISRLEAEYKTLDEENPIRLNVYDFLSSLWHLGTEAFGPDTIASYGGHDNLDTKFPQARFSFVVRTKKGDKWKPVMLIEAYGEFVKDGQIELYEIGETSI